MSLYKSALRIRRRFLLPAGPCFPDYRLQSGVVLPGLLQEPEKDFRLNRRPTGNCIVDSRAGDELLLEATSQELQQSRVSPGRPRVRFVTNLRPVSRSRFSRPADAGRA